MKVEFNSKEEIVECLVKEYGYRKSQLYNSATNKSVEKFWTYSRCLQHLTNLRKNYVRVGKGIMLKANCLKD
jgi:hypothetical protein